MPRQDIPIGLCQCGCGGRTALAQRTHLDRGLRKGEPQRFIFGHRGKFRLEDRIEIDPDTGCHLWTDRLNEFGYARVRIDGRSTMVHRYRWEERNGSVPPAHDLHHVCETKHCVNPDHLVPMTRVAHARTHRELTPAQVEAIREARGKLRQVEIARHFGITQAHISAIQRGKARPEKDVAVLPSRQRLTWKDVALIRMLAAQGVSAPEIARRYGRSRYAIYKILHGETWAS